LTRRKRYGLIALCPRQNASAAQACGRKFTPTRNDAITGSNACQQRAYRWRKNPHRWKASNDDCAWDHEHDKAFPDTSSRQQRRDAATWQEAEALRLAAEYALRRPGAAKQEVTRARIKQARKVASAWKRLADELNF
jgi:hypothetical protein